MSRNQKVHVSDLSHPVSCSLLGILINNQANQVKTDAGEAWLLGFLFVVIGSEKQTYLRQADAELKAHMNQCLN